VGKGLRVQRGVHSTERVGDSGWWSLRMKALEHMQAIYNDKAGVHDTANHGSMKPCKGEEQSPILIISVVCCACPLA